MADQTNQAVTVYQERLPYTPAAEAYGVDRSQWKALVEACFPAAQSSDSVLLALSYCKARKLDPFKRVVHIVPIWDRVQRKLVDTVWPGIGELRTTAFRTGQYIGRGEAEFGPETEYAWGNFKITVPEWCRITVMRLVEGKERTFVGPKVYWIETYAQAKSDDESPNAMWRKRPRGQHEKTAEAAALRAAFPEEIGDWSTADEMEGAAYHMKDVTPADTKPGGAVTAAELMGETAKMPSPTTTPEPTQPKATRTPKPTQTIDVKATTPMPTTLPPHNEETGEVIEETQAPKTATVNTEGWSADAKLPADYWERDSYEIPGSRYAIMQARTAVQSAPSEDCLDKLYEDNRTNFASLAVSNAEAYNDLLARIGARRTQLLAAQG